MVGHYTELIDEKTCKMDLHKINNDVTMIIKSTLCDTFFRNYTRLTTKLKYLVYRN